MSTGPIDSGAGSVPVVRPVVVAGARSAEEIRADLAALVDPEAAHYPLLLRLAGDVEPLLAEVEAVKRDRARLIAELHGAHRDRLRGVVQAVEAPEAIEAAAIALYEDTRDPGYDTPEWDWPNIDRSYDKPDEEETDPEWLRNLYRREARVAVRAALAAAADAPQPEGDEERGEPGPCCDCEQGCVMEGGPCLLQPADPPTTDERPKCKHGWWTSHDWTIEDRYGASDIRCPGPSPAVLPQTKRRREQPLNERCIDALCDLGLGHAGDHWDADDDERWTNYFAPSPPVSGVAGNPEEAGEK